MNTQNRLLSRRIPTQAAWSSTWTHALIWLLLTVAVLLLVAFTAVAEDITHRGERRSVQQRLSGSLMLPDKLQTPGVDFTRLLSITGEKLAGR